MSLSRPFWQNTTIIDISQPIQRESSHFPGDQRFVQTTTLSLSPQDGIPIHLHALTMSPHVGTHADAPLHIQGQPNDGSTMTAGQLPLEPYVGPCVVVDCCPNGSPWTAPITLEAVGNTLKSLKDSQAIPPRILFRTQPTSQWERFSPPFASFSPELITWCAEAGACLMGIDTHSVDPHDSKTLEAHHTLNGHGLAWLENLDLSHVNPGPYILIAAPLKLMTMEAAPVRAILLAEEAPS